VIGALGQPLQAWEQMQRLVAVLLFVPAALIVLPVLLPIRFASPGPFLIQLEREGLHGVKFGMFKVRTMVPNADDLLKDLLANDEARAEQWHQYGCLSADPRIAGWIARIARRLSIDELPQLLNVAAGQMNLVGPRPMPTTMADLMSPGDRNVRRSLKPGITGLWQVSGRSEMSLQEMGQLDHSYVLKRSLGLDLLILLRTLPAVLCGRGAN
jgi:lipopolysaccharide/colanic/teichoic acid biosynthesis glycosyltransferase